MSDRREQLLDGGHRRLAKFAAEALPESPSQC